ncbi:MAG: hypothetical protein RIS94_1985 [Pseudomonadota bacterium]|jgi:hypothetical protein
MAGARRFICALMLALAGCGGDAASPAGPVTVAAPMALQPVPEATAAPIAPALPVSLNRPLPSPWRGLTVDSVANLPAVAGAVGAHHAVPMVRVVMDPGTQPADYARAITALRPRAYVMAELIDSAAMRGTSLSAVRRRAHAFAGAFAGQVDLWEIGNELNGEWVGRNPDEINAKVQAAFDEVAAIHGRTAITLNYWSGPDCYAKAWEPTLVYARTMPPALRSRIDVVMLSIYETACNPAQHPGAAQVGAMLARLGVLFPTAKLAIGEVGAQRVADGLLADPTLANKQRVARTYYGMHATLSARLGARFVGGYFWWYYVQDAVPRTRAQSLWPTLDALISGL